MRRPLVGIILLGLLVPAKGWGTFRFTEEVTRVVLGGIDSMANLDYPQARGAFRRLKGLPGGDLLSPFLEGLVDIDQAMQEDRGEEEITAVLDRFLARMEPVVDRGQALLQAAPDNPDLLLTLGMIRGAKAVVDRTRRHYLDAFRGIRASHRLLTRTLEVDPHRVDALWPLGLYDYAVSRVPALLKPLVAVVLPAGGRERGLARLRRAAREGAVARVPAAVALARILSGLEDEFAEALPYAERLATRYPGNPEFLFLLAFLYSETDHTRRALAVAERIHHALAEKQPHFLPELTPRYLQLRGKIAMDAGAHEQALTFFQQAIEQQNAKYAWITAWAHTRTGMIHDLQGEREKAEESYHRALEIEGGGLAQQKAEQYLSAPYRGKDRRPRRK
ncbi:MAG: tetratricopeptide repeat protein [Candidatus Methylomirabilales bacterium]